ncbi:MAG TPA: plastocyanin/azurin family copper-binding protein [Thermoanaerobaculia bacterium]|jgi:plastocyanin|nr:plastocyanin/azurin family copper-binding protein [Thermoanaerobaculia bacterium]
METRSRLGLLVVAAALVFGASAATHTPGAQAARRPVAKQVIVPEEDRFTPFAQTIRVGDTVAWINMDGDDHTVTTVNPLTTAGNQNVNVLLKGTESNGGNPGTHKLTFGKPGVYVYYCRFHAHLDAEHQPAAPGPQGGIEDGGNFGTPMMGVITVLR